MCRHEIMSIILALYFVGSLQVDSIYYQNSYVGLTIVMVSWQRIVVPLAHYFYENSTATK
jgi:hypothetical protein